MDQLPERRDRLSAVERELADLQAQYEFAMSGFKFDEANAIRARITALEAERRALAAELPAPTAAPEPPAGVVPVIGRARRRPVSRRR